jgi:hypothetical protein
MMARRWPAAQLMTVFFLEFLLTLSGLGWTLSISTTDRCMDVLIFFFAVLGAALSLCSLFSVMRSLLCVLCSLFSVLSPES